MAEYKRKKVKKNFHSKNKHYVVNDEIIMKPKSKKRVERVLPEEEIKVVRGAKYTRRARNKFLLSTIAIVALIYLFFSLILPVSVYENIVNITSLIGHGKYPIDISGSTVLNSVSNGEYYYVLTDTSIAVYSNGGKTVINEMHGFSNPILSVSETRAIVYDQGEKSINIYNLGGKIDTLQTKDAIITASISRSGALAVATHSDGYTSVVNVYDKNLNHIYTWNSAKDIVNNVLVNSTGKHLAVTTFNAISGQYSSKMMILGFDSADPLYTLDLGNSVVLSLTNTGKGVSVVTPDKYKFVHWSKFNTNEVTASGEINLVRKDDKGLLLVFNRANDRSDNTVILISNKGVKIKEFKINNLITDIQYARGRVYYVSDSLVNILDSDGNILRYDDCGYGTQKFAVVSSNSIATITDSQIEKIDIEKGVN